MCNDIQLQFLRFSGLLGVTFALALAGCLAFEMPFVALERAATSSTATGTPSIVSRIG